MTLLFATAGLQQLMLVKKQEGQRLEQMVLPVTTKPPLLAGDGRIVSPWSSFVKAVEQQVNELSTSLSVTANHTDLTAW